MNKTLANSVQEPCVKCFWVFSCGLQNFRFYCVDCKAFDICFYTEFAMPRHDISYLKNVSQSFWFPWNKVYTHLLEVKDLWLLIFNAFYYNVCSRCCIYLLLYQPPCNFFTTFSFFLFQDFEIQNTCLKVLWWDIN